MEILDFTGGELCAIVCVQACIHCVYTCLYAMQRAIIALIMRYLLAETKISYPRDGSNSEIRLHPRFKAQEGAATNKSDVFVFRKALGGRRKTCPGRNDDWIRWFDGKWVGVKWRWRETDKQSKIEYACTGCIDLWERNLCWREMLFVSYTEDFPSSKIVQFFVSRLFSSLFNRESIFFRFLTRHRVASNVGIHRIFGEGESDLFHLRVTKRM